MVDAEMASHLWCRIHTDVARRWGVTAVNHALLSRAQATPRARLDRVFMQQPCAV
jgi:DNA polymerase-3 subunit epsilon